MGSLNFLGELKFGSDGLIPAIIQDVNSGQVLMMAYMNQEALKRTWETGETWFYSRSRQKLWHKGETSGHIQKVRGISFDCDQDTILIKVEQVGAACHEGYPSCFFRELNQDGKLCIKENRIFDPEKVYGDVGKKEIKFSAHEAQKKAEDLSERKIIQEVYQVILDRQQNRPEGSYTAYLFNQGIDKICKKIGEEAAEVIIGAKNRNKNELIYEVADLIYHLLVLMAENGVSPDDVFTELAKRR